VPTIVKLSNRCQSDKKSFGADKYFWCQKKNMNLPEPQEPRPQITNLPVILQKMLKKSPILTSFNQESPFADPAATTLTISRVECQSELGWKHFRLFSTLDNALLKADLRVQALSVIIFKTQSRCFHF